jgi:hypothetical protein
MQSGPKEKLLMGVNKGGDTRARAGASQSAVGSRP